MLLHRLSVLFGVLAKQCRPRYRAELILTELWTEEVTQPSGKFVVSGRFVGTEHATAAPAAAAERLSIIVSQRRR